MDIGKSFSYPFEDNQWLSKLGLGAVISMVPTWVKPMIILMALIKVYLRK